ncbi:MAG: 4Fe-4S binding protein [Slackia sp.]
MDTCILCGICEKRCPTAAISVVKKEGSGPSTVSCVQCGTCVRECPKPADRGSDYPLPSSTKSVDAAP